MNYNAFLSVSLGAPRNHHSIFIEHGRDGYGTVVQVTGNIQTGMTFEVKTNNRPESSPEFFNKKPLGWVSSDDLNRVQQVCAAIPPPKKQFEGPKRLYPAEPLRRCQEWTKEAIEALVAQGILQVESQP